MKTKIMLALAGTLVLGLGIATLAYTGSAPWSAKADCCKGHEGNSCPMMAAAADGEKSSCCAECPCCNGSAESCPMKSGAHAHAVAATEKAHPESCPMKGKAHAVMTEARADAGADAASCCGCPCCAAAKAPTV